MAPDIVSLPVASSSENLLALAEVSHFGVTDMGQSGQGPWTYRILQEPYLSEELNQKSNVTSYRSVDIVSFQPCPSYVSQSQDRFVSEEWDLLGGLWQFNGVFDGHLNHHTVDYVARVLPLNIKSALCIALTENAKISPTYISEMLQSSVQQLDETITSSILNIFPRDPKCLKCLTDAEVKSTFKAGPFVQNNENYNNAARSFGGTTLIISLTDSRGNLWIVSLGDCRAVLGHQTRGGWYGVQINPLHDANTPREIQRIISEHPGEVDAIKNNRIIGYLEPTRAIGDTWLKLPGLYASRVYSNIKQQWLSPERLRKYAQRILTPPYVSNIPDVYHRNLPDRPSFVMLTSDGLLSTDRYDHMDIEEFVGRCVRTIGQALDSKGSQRPNTALSLLRDAIGGEDTHMVSRNLTVEMDERWMDDITVVIQKFGYGG